LQHFINRVFDFLLKEKASDVGSSLKGSMVAVVAAVVRPFKKHTDKEPSFARVVLAFVLAVVQMLVLGIVLCPLAVLYTLGM